MMMMSGRMTSCCVALLLIFTTASAVQRRLTSIYDLDIDCRELLRWFANAVCIDQYGVIQLTFDPNSGDYGAHHYGNFEELLDPLPWGYRYYTLGNNNQRTSLQVPSRGRNKARLIVSIRQQYAERQSQIIDRVYITRHYQEFDYQRSEYDPDQTYEITTSLLREIRDSPMAVHNQSKYRASNFGSAYTSQSWGTVRMQAATRNEPSNFWDNGNSDWSCLVVVALLLLILLIGFLLNTNLK